MVLVVNTVVVLMPVILVCPSNAGLYCGLFGSFVSTGEPGAWDLVEEHATVKNMHAVAKNTFFIKSLFYVGCCVQE
jgi:hypothetical protein